MTPQRLSAVLVGVLVAGALTGCEPTELEVARTELREAQDRVHELEDTNRLLAESLAERDGQVQTLSGLGDKRLDTIVTVDHIGLGKWSGGVDTDGQGPDDGVKVYLKMFDKDGVPIRAAGSAKVQVYDLAADPADTLILEQEWDVDQLAKTWSSGFMSYQYSLEIPWQKGLPKHPEVTIRVTFVDYLTGKTLTTQGIGKVRLIGGDESADELPPTADDKTDS